MKEKKENKKENIKLLKRIIYNLYWKEGLSARKIAKKLGYSCSTILSFMKKHNIPRRRCGTPSKINISKDELKTLYVKMKKSTVEIAKMFNVSRTVVFHTLKKYGIRLRDRIKAVSDGSHKKAIHIKNRFQVIL
jgi:transposase